MRSLVYEGSDGSMNSLRGKTKLIVQENVATDMQYDDKIRGISEGIVSHL